jgi:uncharacterized NAD-dependent epimerase/dehydratase family protein
MQIKTPYLLFLGDARDQLAAKTAQGIAYWRPDWCVGQLRLPDCNATLGLKELTVADAAKAGVKTLIVGVANRGGIISDAWIAVLNEALERGMDLAAGLHNKLSEVPKLRETAARLGRQLFDVRHPARAFPLGTGAKRPGLRLLAVGTDVSSGKMYTTLALEKELKARGRKAEFRATGQTGIFIAGSGVSIDAVVSDFVSGAVETLSPANDPDHWDLVEGQGSLFHASYAGVTLGLIHGSQPDALVMCHEPTRQHVRGLPHFKLPGIKECMEANLAAARLTNPAAKFVGIALNTSQMSEADARAEIAKTEATHGLPTVDPVRQGVAKIADRLW